MKITEKIYQNYVDKAGDWRRPHLGASVIGKPCKRAIWYNYHWCMEPKTQKDGRMLRLFQTGHREEARIIQELRGNGIQVFSHTPDGNQIHLQDPQCPHFSGSVDGVGYGFEDDEGNPINEPVLIEIKTMATAGFKRLQAKGVKAEKPEHYAQMQMYMHWTQNTSAPIKIAKYLCTCKETDEMHEETVYYLKDDAELYTRKAHEIIKSPVPPDRIKNASEKSYNCRFCDYIDLCITKTKCAEVNCRTCAHSTPNDETNDWRCDMPTYTIEKISDQKAGCVLHIYNDQLNPLEFVSADADAGTITYLLPDGEQITNGPGHTSSKDLRRIVENGH